MTLSKLVLYFGAMGMAVAAAASSYKVTLFERAVLGSTELKPGDYKVEVNGEKATFRAGKNTAEAAVKIETGSEKYSQTTVRYSNGDGKYHIQEIRLAGTNTKLVFNN
jgi:hypothetical protein